MTGGLVLARNALLHTFQAPRLVAVLGHLGIYDNPALLLRAPLDALQVVTRGLQIDRNALVTTLECFDHLARVGGLRVVGNPELTSLSLAHLVEAGDVHLEDNAKLAYIGPTPDLAAAGWNPPSLTRLEAVTELRVILNPVLTQLVLPQLEAVTDLFVVSNPVLTQLLLPSLRDPSGQTSITVVTNPRLPTCQASALPASLKAIAGNDDAATCP